MKKITKDMKTVRDILFKEYYDLKSKDVTSHEANTTRKLMNGVIESYRVQSIHTTQKDK